MGQEETESILAKGNFMCNGKELCDSLARAINDVQLSMGVLRVELGKSGKEHGWTDGVELECTKCLIN